MPTVGEELWLYCSQLCLPHLVARDWLTFPTRDTPSIKEIVCALYDLEWSDDIMMTS